LRDRGGGPGSRSREGAFFSLGKEWVQGSRGGYPSKDWPIYYRANIKHLQCLRIEWISFLERGAGPRSQGKKAGVNKRLSQGVREVGKKKEGNADSVSKKAHLGFGPSMICP